jgi:translocator protein
MDTGQLAVTALKLGIAIGICLLPGLIGNLFTETDAGSWYQQLEKPWLNPPGWVFGPVWGVLYVAMGVALYLIWTSGDRSARWYALIVVFGVQLILNGAWSFAFFGLESPIAGLVVIMSLLLLIVVTIILARPISGVASLILVPYLFWVSFATVLNFSIWQLN